MSTSSLFWSAKITSSESLETKEEPLELNEEAPTTSEENLETNEENKEEYSPYILEKGFVAIDGMSLTIGGVSEDCFSLHIIPETLRVTTIESKSEGDMVNIEIDSMTQAIVTTVSSMMKEQLKINE